MDPKGALTPRLVAPQHIEALIQLCGDYISSTDAGQNSDNLETDAQAYLGICYRCKAKIVCFVTQLLILSFIRRSSQEDHTRPDLSTNRAQKKRIEHLERVLHQLKPEDKTLDFSPFKVC